MSTSNKPTIHDYQPITPFKFQVLTNFPYIEADFDALTNYELMCKIVEYLNNVITNTNEVTEDMTNLYNYVMNYFDNLDVTEEINNKLDEMAEDGTLSTLISSYITPLINAQNAEIATFKNSVNSEIDSFDSRLRALASAAPTPVSSTDDMTDTSKVYLLTTDGNWYYYNGEEWISGGTYQATQVADNSIDVLKLDDNLQQNFLKYYTLIENPTHYTNYFCKINGSNKVVQESSTSFAYDKYTLTRGKIYQVSGGTNRSNCVGIIVADSNDNVIYSSAVSPAPTNAVLQQLLFRANTENLYLYVSYEQSGSSVYWRLNLHQVYVLDNVYLNDNFNFAADALTTYSNAYCAFNGNVTANNGSTCTVYNMQKGRSYTVVGENYLSVSGLVISHYNFGTPIYASSDASTPSRTTFSYTWTAESDGLILLSKYDSSSPSSITINQNVTDEQILVNKTISCDGDSIMRGNENSNISYYNLIIAKYGMIEQTRNCYGGATIATGTQQEGVDRHWISSAVLNIDINSDYIIINGGHNDYSNKVPLGEITETFTDTIDSTTFAGGMELLCRNLLNRFNNGQKILFVFNHNINATWYTPNSQTNGHTFKEYYDIQIEVLKKYSIPYIDLIHESQLNTIIDFYKNTYTVGDGVHPNTSGYNKFYVDKIASKMKEL